MRDWTELAAFLSLYTGLRVPAGELEAALESAYSAGVFGRAASDDTAPGGAS